MNDHLQSSGQPGIILIALLHNADNQTRSLMLTFKVWITKQDLNCSHVML